MLRNFKKFIQKELTNMLAWRLAKSTEESLNQILATGGDIIDFSQMGSTNNIWNATLIDTPIFE